MIVVLLYRLLGTSTPGCCRLRQPAPLREKSSSSVDQRGRTRARSRRVGLRSICRRELRCATDQKAASAPFGVGDRDQHLGGRSREFAGDFALRALRTQRSHVRPQRQRPHRLTTRNFLVRCDKPRGSVSGRWFERKSQCDLRRRCAHARARRRNEACSWRGAERRHIRRAREGRRPAIPLSRRTVNDEGD